MPSLRTVAHWTLRAAISAATLAYISYTVDHGDLRATLSAVHMRDLMLPLALYLAGQALSGVKWWLIGSSVGLERPIIDYVRFYFIGMSLNVFGLSTIGGDGIDPAQTKEGCCNLFCDAADALGPGADQFERHYRNGRPADRRRQRRRPQWTCGGEPL